MKCLAQDLEQKLSLDSNLVQEITQVIFLINEDKIYYQIISTTTKNNNVKIFQTLKSSTSDLEERLHEKTCNR